MMMSKSTKTWLTTTLVATGLATLSIFTFIRATPVPASEEQLLGNECFCPPVGSTICCPGESAANITNNGGTIDLVSTTEGCFLVVSCTEPPPCGGLMQTELEIVSFKGTASDPVLGEVTWRNDPDQTSSKATLTQLTDAGAFPAKGTISFYAIAEIAGVDGVYRSEEEVVLVNNNVTSFNPFVNETYATDADAAPIKFVNDVNGDSFELNSLKSTLN